MNAKLPPNSYGTAYNSYFHIQRVFFMINVIVMNTKEINNHLSL